MNKHACAFRVCAMKRSGGELTTERVARRGRATEEKLMAASMEICDMLTEGLRVVTPEAPTAEALLQLLRPTVKVPPNLDVARLREVWVETERLLREVMVAGSPMPAFTLAWLEHRPTVDAVTLLALRAAHGVVTDFRVAEKLGGTLATPCDPLRSTVAFNVVSVLLTTNLVPMRDEAATTLLIYLQRNSEGGKVRDAAWLSSGYRCPPEQRWTNARSNPDTWALLGATSAADYAVLFEREEIHRAFADLGHHASLHPLHATAAPGTPDRAFELDHRSPLAATLDATLARSAWAAVYSRPEERDLVRTFAPLECDVEPVCRNSTPPSTFQSSAPRQHQFADLVRRHVVFDRQRSAAGGAGGVLPGDGAAAGRD